MKRTLSALALIGSGIVLSGCGSSSSSSSSTVDISIPFKAVAGNQAIKCGEDITGLGNGAGGAGTDVKIANFRMFVHDIKLITDQNIEIPVTLDATQASQNADVALLDFRDTADVGEASTEICPQDTTDDTVANPNYNDTVKGSATVDSTYTISSIQFTLGVPFDLNHENQADAVEPLRNPGLASGMAWSWQGGYKFVGFDVLPVGGVMRDDALLGPKWNIHLGSTGCSVSTDDLQNNGAEPEVCVAPNRPVVRLSLEGYNLNEIAIQIDYASLVADNNLGQDDGVAPGCMSGGTDPECEEIFEKFGLSWGENDEDDQSVFSIVETGNDNNPI